MCVEETWRELEGLGGYWRVLEGRGGAKSRVEGQRERLRGLEVEAEVEE